MRADPVRIYLRRFRHLPSGATVCGTVSRFARGAPGGFIYAATSALAIGLLIAGFARARSVVARLGPACADRAFTPSLTGVELARTGRWQVQPQREPG